MNKKFILTIAILVAVMFVASYAMATPIFGDGGAALQEVLDDITVAPVLGDSSVNVVTDHLSDATDSYWAITASGGSVATLIIELANLANENVFGLYDPTEPTKKVEVFEGGKKAGDQAMVSIKADGSVFVNFADSGEDFHGNVFGFFLESPVSKGGGFWFSDTALNSDGLDHLAVYRGTNKDTIQLPTMAPGLWSDNECILAWEDLDASVTDADYTDMVIMVESVNPVPEPGTLFLLGFGLLGVAFIPKKLKFKG